MALFREGPNAEERLQSGSSVRPGDQLCLEIEGSAKMFVYVFEEDQKGEEYALFPAATDLVNPLSESVRYRLPGKVAGRSQNWEISSVGGQENILVIASRKRLKDVEILLAELAKPSPEHAVDALDTAQKDDRGIAGMKPAVPLTPGSPDSKVSVLTRTLTAESANASGVWIGQYHLVNRGD
jgi:hypothetical protein